MPLTLAHPAAALLVRQVLPRGIPLSGLVVGSIVPDLPYFLPLDIARSQTHTVISLLWFALPVGLVVYHIYWQVLHVGVVRTVPIRIAVRVPQSQHMVHPLHPAILIGLLVGATTHLVWDGFTHASGFFVQHFAALRAIWGTVAGYEVSSFKLLQHLSTVVGVLVVLIASAREMKRRESKGPRRSSNASDGRRAMFIVVFGLLAGVGWAVISTLPISLEDWRGTARLLRNMFIGATNGCLLGLLVVGGAHRLIPSKRD